MFFEYEEEKKKEIHEYINDSMGISPYDWSKLTLHYTESEIKNYLSTIIQGLPFPKREYLKHEIEEDWNKLKNSSSLQYHVGEWEAPKQYKKIELKFYDKHIYFAPTNKGQKVSNHQTQLIRMSCGYHSGNSPLYEWQHPNKKSSFLRCLFGILKDEVANKGVNNSILYRALKMHTYMASQFKPELAKSLYDFFGAKRVLDFSAGWGDRLVGFLSSNAESYIGIDPNTKLHEPYKQIVDFCNTNKETRFICSPSEDTDLSDVKVDFIFTSPPYFDIERYSDEETQSWKRYSDHKVWVDKFLLSTMTKCWECLEVGGRIAVNIADKNGIDLCSIMLSHMKSLGAVYEGVIGYKMHKRNGIDLNGIFCEPIFVWSKGEAKEPKWYSDTYF